MTRRKRNPDRKLRRRNEHPLAVPAARTRSPRWLLYPLVVVIVALGITGYQLRPRRVPERLPAAFDLPHGAARGYNVVLFTLDTLRSDRVGCYGYDHVETPVLDGLAAAGVRFADAVTAVPLTLPAHTSIMTGCVPATHGVRDNGTFRLVERHETIAERLKAAGYATAAFIGAFVLDHRYGVDQGFDVYDDEIGPRDHAPGSNEMNPQRPGNIVTDAALKWLEQHVADQADTPFFAWVHLFDPHAPYSPPEPYRSRYATHSYDGEVAYTDFQVGRFVDALRTHGLLDRTLLVLVGDHGEGLGEHGERTHGLLIYGATMRVPLIFHCPGLIPHGQVIDDRVVSVIDIKPTLLDLLGLDPGSCDGISLLTADVPSARAVYQECLAPQLAHGWSPLHALRRHHEKYIEAPTPEFYDLRKDRAEIDNLWTDQNEQAAVLAAELQQRLASFPGPQSAEDAHITPDDSALAKLQSLGYVRGAEVQESETPLDPKEMVARWDKQMAAANAHISEKQFAQAIPLIEELLEMSSADASLWSLLSIAQSQTGQLDAAIASRRRALELQPRDGDGWVLLATLLYAKGDLAASEVSLAEAESLDPDLGGIYITRALQALYAKRYEEALNYCAEARRRDPTRYTAKSWSLQAKVHQALGQLDEARAAMERARGGKP